MMKRKNTHNLEEVLRRSKQQLNRDLAPALSEREHRVAAVLREWRLTEKRESRSTPLAQFFSALTVEKLVASAVAIVVVAVFGVWRFAAEERDVHTQSIAMYSQENAVREQGTPGYQQESPSTADAAVPVVVSVEGFDGTPEVSEVSFPLVLIDDGAYEQDDMEYAWTVEHMALDPGDVSTSLELTYEDIETEA